MKLEAVSIKRFRSIESTQLVNCGGFNVFIGKNNSGKSNILSGIGAFFTCIRDNSILTLDPPIGQEIDFFAKRTDLPIEIALSFSLSLAERDALIRDIVTEAPQMKNAVDGLDPSLRLSTTINIVRQDGKGFGFVSKLALGGTVKPGARQPDPERIPLRIGNNAALELYKEFSRIRQRRAEAEDLRNMRQQLADSPRWSFFQEQMKERGEIRLGRSPSSFLTGHRKRAPPVKLLMKSPG